VDMTGSSSGSTTASALVSQVQESLGESRTSTVTITQTSTLSVSYDENTLTQAQVLQATEAVACTFVENLPCSALLTASRRRSLVQSASISLARTLRQDELILTTPEVSADAIATELGVSASAISGVTPPTVSSVTISVSVDSLRAGDSNQLILASSNSLGVDASALTVVSVSMFPPSPPPPPSASPPAAPSTYLCTNTCFFANDGVCNDGSAGSTDATCGYAMDCADCGARAPVDSSPPPPPVPPIDTGSQALTSDTVNSNIGWIIGIGVAIAVIICGFGVLYWRYARASKKVKPDHAASPPDTRPTAANKASVTPFSALGGSERTGSNGAVPSSEDRTSNVSRLALQRAKRWQPTSALKLSESGAASFVEEKEHEHGVVARGGRPALRSCRPNLSSVSTAPYASMDDVRGLEASRYRTTTIAQGPFSSASLDMRHPVAPRPKEEPPAAPILAAARMSHAWGAVDPALEASMAAAARARASMGAAPRPAPRMAAPALVPVPLSDGGRAALERARRLITESSPSGNPDPHHRVSGPTRLSQPPVKWRNAPTPPLVHPSPLQHRSAPTPSALAAAAAAVSQYRGSPASPTPGYSPPPSPPMVRTRRSAAALDFAEGLQDGSASGSDE